MKDTADQAFEFVLADNLQLEGVTPDTMAFQDHLKIDRPDDYAYSSPNLSGDALLMLPCP